MADVGGMPRVSSRGLSVAQTLNPVRKQGAIAPQGSDWLRGDRIISGPKESAAKEVHNVSYNLESGVSQIH